jgi:hypothetical protein
LYSGEASKNEFNKVICPAPKISKILSIGFCVYFLNIAENSQIPVEPPFCSLLHRRE